MTAISVQTDGNEFRFGTQSLKVTTGDTGDNALFPADPVAVSPDESRTFSAYVKTEAALTGGSIYLRIAQAGMLTPVLAESDAVTDSTAVVGADANGWVRIIVTLTIPSGVFTVRPYIQYDGATAGQVFWVDGIKFEKGAVASLWQENIVSRRAVVDQSGFQVDASEGGIVRYRGAAGGDRDSVALGDHGFLFGGDTELASSVAGQLEVDGTAVSLEGHAHFTTGSTFPGSPASGDLHHRTDLGEWFRYDGAQWRCTVTHEIELPGGQRAFQPITGTVSANAISAVPELAGGSDIYIIRAQCNFLVNSGGTALGPSHKWVVGLNKTVDNTATETTIATFNIDSGSSAVWRRLNVDVTALMNNGTAHRTFLGSFTKTGTPGSLYAGLQLSYNHVAT